MNEFHWTASPSRPGRRRAGAALLLAALGMALALLVQPASAAATTTISAPAANSTFTPTNRPQLTVRGTATPTPAITGIRLITQNVATGHYRQDDGSFAPAWDAQYAGGTTAWSLGMVLPEGQYTIRARAERGTSLDVGQTVTVNVDGRDPLRWPYPSASFWNTPRGADATLVPLDMAAPASKTLRAEDDLLFFDPYLPTSQYRTISPHSAGWNQSLDRCQANWAATMTIGGSSAFPMRNLVAGTQFGSVPNHSTAIVMPDLTLRETQPLAKCAQGYASQYASPKWQGDSVVTGGLGPNATSTQGGGSHGGAFMTAFGGTIRLGEWVPSGNIPHATKIELFSQMWLTRNTSLFSGYRWPALAADSGWNSTGGYGSQAPTPRSPHAVMGALLTLPNSFDVSALATEPARILARSIRDYGTYIVDGTGRDTVQFATEWSPEGRVLDEFESAWGYELDGDRDPASTSPKNQFLGDMETIYENLHIVADNAKATVGGAGARLGYAAPAIDSEWTG